MAVLVFVENSGGEIKKASLEAVVYSSRIAEKTGKEVIAVSTGEADFASLGAYGAKKVLVDKDQKLKNFDARAYVKFISNAVEKSGAQIVVLSNGYRGKAIAAGLSVRLKGGLVTGAVDLPDQSSGFVVKKAVFSGNAFAHVEIKTPVKIIAVNPNTLQFSKGNGSAVVEEFNAGLKDADFKVKVKSVEKISGKIPLAEAEKVVSGGRGLKGPENWHLVEELGELLSAAVACSRPVADSGWRPHHEHVGQTGGTIRPNLYLAIGISGAIQHLAGVNQSKTIVVINKDPEAPFFKAADYGIIGDAFEVVPKLIEAAKKLKAQN